MNEMLKYLCRGWGFNIDKILYYLLNKSYCPPEEHFERIKKIKSKKRKRKGRR